MTKYRIRPDGYTQRKNPETRALEPVPEYVIERASRDWVLFFPVTDWTTVMWTTKPEDFEDIIKRDALERAKTEEHNASTTRYARTTLYMKSLSQPTPIEAVVHHLEK